MLASGCRSDRECVHELLYLTGIKEVAVFVAGSDSFNKKNTNCTTAVGRFEPNALLPKPLSAR
jgi:hypothetical protein